MITYNNLIKAFNDFADNHFMINAFEYGTGTDNPKEPEYPLMHVAYQGSSYAEGVKAYGFTIMFLDIPATKDASDERIKEVISDCEQLAEDLINDVVLGGNIFSTVNGYDVQSADVVPVVQEETNVLSGVALNLILTVPYQYDSCDLPLEGVTPTSDTCDSATYRNSDGTFVQVIASGATFTADDITVTDVDGTTREVPANEDVTCEWTSITFRSTDGVDFLILSSYANPATVDNFAYQTPSGSGNIPARNKIKFTGATPTSITVDSTFINVLLPSGGVATYENSDSSFTQDINAGDTYVAADITVTDVDGSTRTVPANINVTALWKVLLAKNSAGTTLATVSAYPSGGNIAIPDQSIDLLASDAYVLKSVTQVVGADVSADDIEITDDDTFTDMLPARSGIRVIGSTIESAVINGDYIDVTVSGGATGIIYKRPMWCGQDVSYSGAAAVDVGAAFLAGDYDYNDTGNVCARLDVNAANPFYTLVDNNAFGSKYRFTADDGTPASDGLADFTATEFTGALQQWYVIDHLTGLGYYMVKLAYANNWQNSMNAIDTFNGVAEYSDFRAISDAEFNAVVNDNHRYFETGNIFRRSLGSVTGNDTNMWLGNTDLISASTNAFVGRELGDIARFAKTTTSFMGVYAVRNHY